MDLLNTGRSVAGIAHDLQISDQTVYAWRRQDRIDRGEITGMTTAEKAELRVAKNRIAALEMQLAVATKAVEVFKAETDANGGTRRSS
ncbi:transposase [Nesterenkonia sp. E16_7]|nr:transposase [Nesterenkonia sp. E16_10]MBO0598228.1 transposase [Nesterenkonia sp. E16_7]